ncbi:nucleotide disphospho-sugar-binding domain-containing protein [Streptomyces flaveolus]|uniref:glycosyltransferase n=1 Tax=Streptomyces flaveolus TaxID=67297 RepID=UPI0033AF7666
MRVLLSGSRGDVEPLAELAQRLADVGVPLIPVGPSACALTRAAPPASFPPRRAAELVAGQRETVTAAAEGCEVLVATGVLPVAMAVAEKLGVRSVYVAFQQLTLPAPHRRPLAYPGRPLPSEVTDNEVLWDLDAQSVDALFGEALQTGAWLLPDERPLPAGLAEFLEAGTPPVYVGGMPPHAAADIGEVAVEAVRAPGRRAVVARGRAGLSPVDGRNDRFVVGEVNQQALFGRVAAVVHHGGAGTTATATRAGAPQVVVPRLGDQPYWAGRVAQLGIGAAHDGPTPTFASRSAALRAALAPETRARAAGAAGRVRTDGASVAARLPLDAHG